MNPETKIPYKEPILNEELNNITFNYCYFKNYCAYLKHQNYLFYFKINNDRQQNQTVLELFKFDLYREKAIPVGRFHPFTCPTKTSMFAAQI